ncbi:TPA: hypothetical protein DEG21_03445 [Patescibacteria group bacterium]|nr:hypothetical protein [Candidatus Gracilibacteria bacterium]HBY74910.1 hypothetical protein [Candidatus Gracilibacteria bacterium]
MKNIQVDLIIWFTITLSIPFITNVPLSVIRGKPHIYTSCSLISQVPLFSISSLTLNGASKLRFFLLQSETQYFGSSKEKPL